MAIGVQHHASDAFINKNAPISKISKTSIKFASVLGHLVISLDQNLFIFIIFLLVKYITQATNTKKARISNVPIKKLYNFSGIIYDKKR